NPETATMHIPTSSATAPVRTFTDCSRSWCPCIVPAEATVIVDVRVESAGERERIESAFAALAPHLDGARITVEGSIGRPPMPESASAELFAVARRLLPGLEGKAVGGGSDGNFTAALGVPTLDGLGAVGGGAHADHEYVVIASMTERANLVTGLVRAIQGAQDVAPGPGPRLAIG
ncbi:M20/M25/M40 family metallo-hydrolase, partial [Streptomyces sp. NPDC048551]|uniref:M20/M25/M40 family metallo-hydrolase n=1 Tax=Streptomyces sp. NPDC048551 TaxID=3155758 RepID=UPI0034234D12